ncbi:MAG: bifunctional aspartate kinase/homoserine dehydrogenase I [Proteobacteria bacterium]|nr:bifunctional aspartate kinase/homoserine dehydrogenase I [Pseudomonadota bacterium]
MKKPVQCDVFKFGGTSVGSADAVERAISIVRQTSVPVVVVVSAAAGITDLLHAAVRSAAAGDDRESERAVTSFYEKYESLIQSLVKDGQFRQAAVAALQSCSAELRAICSSLMVLRELTQRSIDVAVARGERMSALIFSYALRERDVRAGLVDAADILFVNRRFSALVPQAEKCLAAMDEKLIPALENERIVVVPGYIASGADGELLTLGRGGSDYSATLLAGLLKARQVVLYKEVDGFLTADPRYVSDARVVPELNYREATELAYYGAKVLHPRSIIPLLADEIPLTIKNSLSPEFAGTQVTSRATGLEFPVKAMTAMAAQTMLTVAGNGMLGVPGIAGKTFATLAAHGISVSVITQASSESSICFVVPADQALTAQRVLNEAFEYERSARLIDEVKVDSGIAVLAVVGLGMKGTPGIASRVFTALSRKKINILAIAQGSSELNISMVILEQEVKAALNELHAEFRLEKLRPLPERVEKHIDIAMLGCGQIGRTFLRQVMSQKTYLNTNLGVSAKCLALVDSTSAQINTSGFPDHVLNDILRDKDAGLRLVKDPSELPIQTLRRGLFTHALAKGVVVDVTADDTWPTLMEFIEQGFHVVLANKKPLTVPMDNYKKMYALAAAKGVWIRHEATVGAGLPVLDTIAKLQSAGDTIESMLGCLSGTLGYISTQISAGVHFSTAVGEARRLGYTEPHPAEDLSGRDVARKALILARTIGREVELDDIKVTPLFRQELFDADPNVFVNNLRDMDDEIAALVAEGRKQGTLPRFVARIEKERISVGLEMAAENSPLGGLRGTDNQIVFRSQRYSAHPLVVTGPGAGADVTAAGVLNDVVSIAVSHFGR